MSNNTNSITLTINHDHRKPNRKEWSLWWADLKVPLSSFRWCKSALFRCRYGRGIVAWSSAAASSPSPFWARTAAPNWGPTAVLEAATEDTWNKKDRQKLKRNISCIKVHSEFVVKDFHGNSMSGRFRKLKTTFRERTYRSQKPKKSARSLKILPLYHKIEWTDPHSWKMDRQIGVVQ